MPSDTIERLNYFQRQFLGAEDFKDQQIYHRDMRRRHNLGHHTWGIVVGLELVEKPKEGGGEGVDVYLQPGLAIDGYGREIVVLHPYPLDKVLFDPFASPKHCEVWIAYDEEPTRSLSPSHETCDIPDQFKRLRETFRIVVEPNQPTHSDVIIDGKRVESPPPPPPPLTPSLDDLTIPLDESVPYQEFPEDDDSARWLVRLGSVHWSGVDFLKTDEERLLEERRYIGNVTEEILAPAKKLNIRDRNKAIEEPNGGVAVEIEGSLQVDKLITAKSDVQIHGGKLDFRDTGGSGGEQFTVQRVEPGGASGVDLRIKIGDEKNGENRLVVGSGDDATGNKVAIDDNGTLLIDGGQVQLGKQGSEPPEWGVKVEGKNLQFLEPNDSDRVVFEVLDTSSSASAAIRLQGNTNATLSANQLIELTGGEVTELHTHETATNNRRGMVEIARPNESGENGNSGARLVIPANDPRILTQFQKDELTDGGLTTLHSHPSGILNNVETVPLHALGLDIKNIVLGSPKRVFSFISLRSLDQGRGFGIGVLGSAFADIYVDVAAEEIREGTGVGVYAGPASQVVFRLRSTGNIEVQAIGVVFYEDL